MNKRIKLDIMMISPSDILHNVPNKFYEVGLNLLDLKHKSNLGKSKRKLMGDDVKDF